VGTSELGVLIPIIAVTLGLGCAIVAVVSKHRHRLHELEFRHRERMAAIDKGLELPPEPTQDGYAADYWKHARSGPRVLLKGLVWLGVGIALVLPGDPFGSDHHFWTFGWIAVAVGAAYLIYYFVEARHRASPGQGFPGGSGSAGNPGSSKEGPPL